MAITEGFSQAVRRIDVVHIQHDLLCVPFSSKIFTLFHSTTAQFRHDLKVKEDPRHFDEYYIASYHEIMEYYVGKWLKYFSMAVVWFNLISLATVQIIASASNL